MHQRACIVVASDLLCPDAYALRQQLVPRSSRDFVNLEQTFGLSAISRASSTSMPKYRTVLTSSVQPSKGCKARKFSVCPCIRFFDPGRAYARACLERLGYRIPCGGRMGGSPRLQRGVPKRWLKYRQYFTGRPRLASAPASSLMPLILGGKMQSAPID
jgi:hypothetical protein